MAASDLEFLKVTGEVRKLQWPGIECTICATLCPCVHSGRT